MYLYIYLTLVHLVLQANLCLTWVREISKSPLLFTRVCFQIPQLAKTKYFVLFGFIAFVLLHFNTNRSRFIYAIDKTVSLHVYFSTSYILPKVFNVTCVKRNSLCWFSPRMCVLVQNCIYFICRVFGGKLLCMCLSTKPRFAFLSLMTVEKVKRMQGNLTLVVSWNVGENQVMEWGAMAWKFLDTHSEKSSLKQMCFKGFLISYNVFCF